MKQISDQQWAELARPHLTVEPDKTHLNIIRRSDATSVDRGDGVTLYQCHTFDLVRVAAEMLLPDDFKTNSLGTDLQEPNCFFFLEPGGSLKVYRFGKGTNEHESWNQDGQGWTWCEFNSRPTLKRAADKAGFVKMSSGGYQAASVTIAIKTIADTYQVDLPAAPIVGDRPGVLVEKSGGMVVLLTDRHPNDSPVVDGWANKGKSKLERVLYTPPDKVERSPETLLAMWDDSIRVIRTPDGETGGIYFRSSMGWTKQDAQSAKRMLMARGLDSAEAELLLGEIQLNPWIEDRVPFGDEYPAGRKWNRGTWFNCKPCRGDLTLTNQLINHLGRGLDQSVEESDDCKRLGINSGGDWLRAWLRLMVQKPSARLPWLMLYSATQNNCGKSSLLRHIQNVLNQSVYFLGDSSADMGGSWNDHFDGKALIMLDEVGLSGLTAEGLRNLIDSRQIAISKRQTSKVLKTNYLHFLQCSNDLRLIPVVRNDTRVVIAEVPPLALVDPNFEDRLAVESEAFLYDLLNGPVPSIKADRCYLPVLMTSAKSQAISINDPDADPAEIIAHNLRKHLLAGGGTITGLTSMELYGIANPGMTSRQFGQRVMGMGDAFNAAGIVVKKQTVSKRSTYTLHLHDSEIAV